MARATQAGIAAAQSLERVNRAARDPSLRVLLSGGAVLTMDTAIGDLPRGDVLIAGSTIEDVGVGLADRLAGNVEVVDVSGAIVMPGMHDTHRHCWETQLRRLFPDVDLGQYIDAVMVDLSAHYRPNDVHVATRLSAAAALDSGITCVMDYFHNSRSVEHADAAVEAWLSSGMRAAHAPAPPMMGDWDEQWPDDLYRLKSRYFSSDDQLVTLRVGLASPIPQIGEPVALGPNGIRRARELGIGMSVDGFFGPVAGSALGNFAEQGLLGEDMTFIHCQDIGRDAWQRIADAGAHVSLATTSDTNLRISSADCPVQDALDCGIRPSLSIDVECSLSSDMFTQMRAVLAAQRASLARRAFDGEVDLPEPLSVHDVLAFATIDGARANGLATKTGSLTPGKQADLIVLGADDVNNMPLNHAAATVVLGADGRNVEAVFVAGRVQKWGGRLVGFDPVELNAEAVASRDYLLGRAGRSVDALGAFAARPARPAAVTPLGGRNE